MGGFLPTAAMSVLQMGVQTAEQRQQAQHQQRQAEMQLAAKEAQARSDIARIQQAQQADERERRAALRRAMAEQRARFGAQGVAGGRSSGAVLAGLAAEADRERQESREQTRLRTSQIRETLDWQKRKNLLDSTQQGRQATFGLIQQGLRRVPLLPF